MKTFLTLATLLCGAAIVQAQWANQQNAVPAFHPTPPAKGEVLPAVLTEKELAAQAMNQPVQVASYKAVAKMPAVMYQQPCYCYCDRGHGHKSLHSCFESEHGGNCAVCMKEVYYSYQMTQQKKTPEQIRMGIVSGEWQQIDLEKAASIGVDSKPAAGAKPSAHKT